MYKVGSPRPPRSPRPRSPMRRAMRGVMSPRALKRMEPQWKSVPTFFQPFDQVFVIHLLRRPDRLDAFFGRGPAEWPWMMPIIHEATDGETVKSPGWFKGPPGAWGCLMSHVAIWDMQIKEGWDSVLVLEDDAEFCHGSVKRMRDTLDCVPDDWDQIYFGGQHWKEDKTPPVVAVRNRLVRCKNVNRTHAYAIRLPFAQVARDMVMNPDWPNDGNQHHIDYRLGEMHASHNIYAPWRFCIGQARGESDVRSRNGRSAHVTSHLWNKFPIAEVV